MKHSKGIAVYYGSDKAPWYNVEGFPWRKKRKDAISLLWGKLIELKVKDLVLIEKKPNPKSLDPWAIHGSVGAKFNLEET